MQALIEAATGGDPEAQYELALRHDNGQDPAGEQGRDAVEAARWYRLAANQGHAGAQLHLGLLYDSGDGVEKNEALAAQWYRKSADQGNADAQVNLGLMYLNGSGVAKNEGAAVHCFRMAAETGHPKAQFNLGALLYNGVGGNPDLGQVYQWWTLAALKGHPSAQKNLELVAGKLNREQLAAAQAAVADVIRRTQPV